MTVFKWAKTKKAEPAPTEAQAPETFKWVRYLDSFRNAGLKVAILIDGNSIFCREFHAHPDLRTSAGAATGAIYGWARAMMDFLQIAKPQLAAIAWDGAGGERAPNFRRAVFPEYKAGRKRDERLEEQLNSPFRFALTEVLGIPQFGDGYAVPGEEGIAEADDILATLARRLRRTGEADVVAVISGDRDLLQLIGDGAEEIHVMSPKMGISILDLWTGADVRKKYGVGPQGLRVYKAIVGDASDAIPGVMGLGEKKFAQIVEALGVEDPSLETILSNTDRYPGKIGKMLTEHAEDAALFHEIVRLRDDVILPDEIDVTVKDPDWGTFFTLCRELEFKSLLPGATEVPE